MLIISKYKDYYDYIQGTYGVDSKLVLDRTKGSVIEPVNGLYTFFIGGYIIQQYYENGVLIEPDYIKANYSEYYWDHNSYYLPNGSVTIKFMELTSIEEFLNSDYKKLHFMKLFKESLNKPHDIFVVQYNSSYIAYPKLSNFKLADIIPPEEIWRILSDYLSSKITKQESGQSFLSDKEKIITHGFDPKTSFRKT